MRRLIRQLIEDMTYLDLSGRRRPRRYVIAAGLLFLAMIPMAFWALHERSRVMAVVHATPAPPATPWPTRTPTPPPAPTPTPVVDEAGCPADPKEWTLEPIVIAPGAKPLDLFRIRPDCVYRGLAQSVAALMLADMGWKPPEIVEALGLPRFPVRYHPVITVTMEYTLRLQGEPSVLKREGLPSSAAMCPPQASPDRCPRLWAVGLDGTFPFRYALRGCFYPRHLSAGRVVDWGMPYPVICVVRSMTYPYVWSGMVEGTEDRFRHVYRDVWSDWNRFFGYDPSLRIWLDIGSGLGYSGRDDPQVIERVRDRGRQELEKTAAPHGLPVWDQAWLEAFTGLKPKPLPPDWASWPDRIREFYGDFLEKYHRLSLEEAKAAWSR